MWLKSNFLAPAALACMAHHAVSGQGRAYIALSKQVLINDIAHFPLGFVTREFCGLTVTHLVQALPATASHSAEMTLKIDLSNYADSG